MSQGMPPSLSEALARLDAARRSRQVRWRPPEEPPREASPPVRAARHKDPGDAAKSSPRYLSETIRGEIPWWARD